MKKCLSGGAFSGVEGRSAREIVDQVREGVARWREFGEEMGVPGPRVREIEEKAHGRWG